MNLGIHSLLHVKSGEELGHGAQMQELGDIVGRMILPPQGHLALSADLFVVKTCREGAVVLAFRGERPVTLPGILQCTGRPPQQG